MSVSIIVPCLNESDTITSLLDALFVVRRHGGEVIVVDGGSQDDTCLQAKGRADLVLQADLGRATQMNCGARHAQSDWLWFLHADSVVSEALVVNFLSQLPQMERSWGRFDVRLSGQHPMFRIIEFMINKRSRITGVATGDQGIFVKRDLFESIGAYPELPLMEDVAISKRLKAISPPIAIEGPLLTSSRRWEERGIFKTILLMWRLRLAYFMGVPVEQIAEKYC